ncbi:MAG: Ig-like domain-containing protein [Calditrichia bacterium]
MRNGILFIVLLFILQCAVRKPPQGGPPDTTPPFVISTFPQPDSINIKELEEIRIKFNEIMNRSSVEKALHCNVLIKDQYSLKWKNSKDLRIKLNDHLTSGLTYVFTIGTAATDANGNRLTQPFNLAFSTDSILHQCSVSGKIINQEPNKIITVQAIPLNKKGYEDSLWYRIPPANITTSQNDGSFTLSYLKPGLYRLLAFEDSNFDFRFDPQMESYGLFTHDVFFQSNGDVLSGYFSTIVKTDSSAVFIDKIKISEKDVALVFTLNRNTHGITHKIFNTKHQLLPSISGKNPQQENEWLLYFKEPVFKDSVEYQFIIPETGDTLRDFYSYEMEPDSLPKPGFSVSISDPLYFEDHILIKSTTPVDSSSFSNGVQLSGGENSVPYMILWNDFRSIGIIPEGNWKIGAKYLLSIDMTEIKDYWGRSIGDSLIEKPISIISQDELGGIAGKIAPKSKYPHIALKFTEIQSNKLYQRLLDVDPSGKFELNNLPEGRYIVWGWYDNGDMKLDGGTLEPFQYPEPLLFSQDTIRIRPRWIKEGFIFDE